MEEKMRIKGYFKKINEFKSASASPLPDLRKLGLDRYTEYDVPEDVRFGQIPGYELVFASANTSSRFPDLVLVQEGRKHLGVPGDAHIITRHWIIAHRDLLEEWVQHHELREKCTVPIAVE